MRSSTLVRFALFSLLGAGCVGTVGDGAAPPGPSSPSGSGGAGMTARPGPGTAMPPIPSMSAAGRLRRLTSAQFRNTLRDLLGEGVTVGEVEPDSLQEGFASIGAAYNSISAHGIEQYDGAAQAAAHQVFGDPARRAQLLGCAPTGADDAQCVRSFLTGFGRRAWRRPLTAEELDDYTRVALDGAKLLGDANAALEQVLVGLLTSPSFLYRVEVGAREADGRYRYTGWELASRMSYFLWNSTPDDALLDAAAAGALDQADGARAQAMRLVQSPRARAGFSGGFGRELLWLDALADAPKNDARYTDALRASMETEVLRLFESQLDPGRDLFELLDGTRTFVDANLAALYGVPRPAGAGAMVELPASGQRAGLLGTAAFLSIYSAQDRTSPTARGVFVRERLLCQPMPEPPDNVNVTLPSGNLTMRERLEEHRKNPGCAGCHAAFDPVGYAFEGFDWIGAARDKDAGRPIDSSGNLDDFKFADARGLTSHLREMPEARDCLLKNLFRTANGHLETDADAATFDAWRTAFDQSKRSLPLFLAAVVSGDTFRAVSSAP